MSFATPIWLFALLPWLGLAGWMLWGQRRRVRVPFLPMWEGPAFETPPRRGVKLPPPGAIFAMVALLLSIAAAAGPMFNRGGLGSSKPAMVVIVDHGLTMSALDDPASARLRYVAAAGELARLLSADQRGSLPIAVVDPVSDQQRWTDLKGLINTVAGLAPTALDMHAQTEAAAARVLADNAGPAVVLTDRPLARPASPGLVRVSPPGQWNTITIAALAARLAPVPQVMLRLRNDSLLSQAAVRIRSGDKTVSKTIDLPARGKEQDYFFDLPLGETVSAQVRGDGDARAYLLRQGIAANVEPSPDLPPAVTRMLRVYSKERGTGPGAQAIQVATSMDQVAGQTAAVIVASPDSGPIKGPFLISDHPIMHDVAWSDRGGRFAGNPPQGWQPVLKIDDHVLVAVRERPARQVWIGFNSEGFDTTPAFVVFWTNVLDWVAGARQQYAASSIAPVMEGWRRESAPDDSASLAIDAPGIYARADGSRQAFNAPVLPAPIPPDADEAAAIHRLAASLADRPPGPDVGPIALWVSLACLLGAAAVWKRP